MTTPRIKLQPMDPLALLPYALAAGGGRVGPFSSAQLVAAGLTLLQRSAALVRALNGMRAGVLLDNGPAWVVALAASEGRGAVILHPGMTPVSLRAALTERRIGVVFTSTDLATLLPPECPHVTLDEAPARAQVVVGGQAVTVDLGAHFGLDLVGDTAVPGAEEECVIYATSGQMLTHRALLAMARHAVASETFTPLDRTCTRVALSSPGALPCGLIAPLLTGGMLDLSPIWPSNDLKENLQSPPFTKIVGHPEVIATSGRLDSTDTTRYRVIAITPQS
jgi:hypothetical protein